MFPAKMRIASQSKQLLQMLEQYGAQITLAGIGQYRDDGLAGELIQLSKAGGCDDGRTT